MQILHDYYLVAVDQLFESNTTPYGIITSNTAIIHPEQEDRGEFKRRFGVVMEVPVAFSDNPVSMEDPGSPAPRKFVGHDWIELMRTIGHKDYDHKRYYPSTFEMYKPITCKDVSKKVNVVEGEKIYFDEKATETDRYMGMYEGKLLYSIRVDEIICCIRKTPTNKHKIFMQGGWLLLEPDMENWEEITIPIEGKNKDQWLQAKIAPEGRWLRGIVRATNGRDDLKGGDKVVFVRDADAPITVEGKEYTVMMHDEVLAKVI